MQHDDRFSQRTVPCSFEHDLLSPLVNITSKVAPQTVVLQSQAGTRDLAEVYAEEGAESCAGMTWREQEQLQERQQDAEIATRVLAFTSAPFRIPLLPAHR